jgi:hypothetical protein
MCLSEILLLQLENNIYCYCVVFDPAGCMHIIFVIYSTHIFGGYGNRPLLRRCV